MSSDYKKPVPRGTYILQAVDRYTLNGDAYIMWDDVYRIQKIDIYYSFVGDLETSHVVAKLNLKKQKSSVTYLHTSHC